MNSNYRLSQGDLEDLLPWHAAGTLDQIKKEHKKQLEEIVTPIMTKLYGQGGAGGAPPPPHGHDEDSL